MTHHHHIAVVALLALLAVAPSAVMANTGLFSIASPATSSARDLAYGTLTRPDGTRYEGEMRSGSPDGKGTLHWRDGSLYYGSFRAGQRDGEGLLRLPDGSSHRVSYRNDRMTAGPIAAVQFERSREDQAGAVLNVQERIAVEVTVEQWLKAWADQDANSYLAAYHPGFTPTDGSSHEQWAALRKHRLAGPKWIRLSLEQLEVRALPGGDAEAVFVQRYSSDRFSDVVRKTLTLAEQRGQWQIVEETAATP